MAKTRILNTSSGLLTLPGLLGGVLAPGGSVVIDVPSALVRSAIGPSALGKGVEVNDSNISGSDPFASIYRGRLGIGIQTAWAIDPIRGLDTNDGSPFNPLKTMAAFNDIWSGSRFNGVATLQLVGDVTDEALLLDGVRFTNGGSLTVVGTVTTVTSGTISSVTVLQSNCTFQLTTTGVVWTSGDVGKRLQLATGHTCWVQEFVDANNVVVGPVTNTTTAITPTAVAFDVQTVSAALPPQVNCSGTGGVGVAFQHQAFTAGTIQNAGNAGISFYGCKVVGGSLLAKANVSMRGCLHQLTGITQGGLGAAGLTLAAHTFVGSVFQAAGVVSFAICSWATTVLATAAGTICLNAGAMHFRNSGASNCITISQGSRFTNQNFALSGSVGNTGFGINVRAGCGFTYLIAGTKPTVTGTAGDTKIGTATTAYSAVPYIDSANGSPAFMALEN